MKTFLCGKIQGFHFSDRINQLNLGEQPEQPVVFVGDIPAAMDPSMIKGDTVSASHFSWDLNTDMRSTPRILEFFGWMHINYTYPSQQQYDEAVEIAETMQVWPHTDSVAEVDGVIIVKLSEIEQGG